MVKIIEPSFEILDEDEIDGIKILKKLERIGRICYKSEDKITENSYKKFLRMILKNGHESIIEHISISIRFIVNRGFTHELVRHRLSAYSQESTRYCSYNKNKFNSEITVIKPFWFKNKMTSNEFYIWYWNIEKAEKTYFNLLEKGQKTEQARGVLPLDLKTEIVMSCNLRELRHIFNLRCSKNAHPQMREIMLPLLDKFHTLIPIVFDDLYEKYSNDILN